MAKDVVIYARLSVEREESTSIDRQIEACSQLADARSWTVTEECSDIGVSGAAELSNRAGLSRALAIVEAGEASVLVVYKMDRLARTVRGAYDIVERLDAVNCSLAVDTKSR